MDYDIAIIGGGPAGYSAAIYAAKCNLKVALIEQERLGGTCLNKGCIPTKALLHTSFIYHQQHSATNKGIKSTITYDDQQAYRYKDQLVDQLVDGIQHLINAHKISFYNDHATFNDKHTLLLKQSQQTITSDNIIIATGASSFGLPFIASDIKFIYNSDDVLKNPLTQTDITIIGGGVIGCELATYYHQLGRRVTIIEIAERLLPEVDKELSQNLQMNFKRSKIEILTNAKLLNVAEENDGLSYTYQLNEQSYTRSTQAIIIAIGRKPNIEGLNLNSLDLKLDKGHIKVNEHYQTSLDHIFAIGDVNGKIQLAHVATAQAEDCIRYITNQPMIHQAKTIPYCIYTTPEIAYAGLNESQAKQANIDYQISKYLLNSNGRYLIETDQRGFIKVIFSNKVIIGAQLYMEHASEYIGFFTMAIDNKLNVEQIANSIYPHPTISEALKEVTANINNQALHILTFKR